MTFHLLDREGDAPILGEYTLITSEVDFLRLATEEKALHVRGERLCNWAETFFRARGIAYKETVSVKRELGRAFPSLSGGEIESLLDRVGESIHSVTRPLTAEKLLNMMYPSSLWTASPSLSHLAEWLLWVYENRPTREIQEVMLGVVVTWSNLSDQENIPYYLEGVNPEYAEKALTNWLGIDDREAFLATSEFPLNEIPTVFIEKALDKWNMAIVESHGSLFEHLDNLVIPFSLKKLAAKETYQYFLRNSGELTNRQIARLARYLSYKEVNELRRRLEPTTPSSLPETPETVVAWFLSEYLPYREWQDNFAPSSASEAVQLAARQFAEWYLKNYPKALTGGSFAKWISFYRTAHLDRGDNILTLVIVLDGLHAADTRTLIQNIRTHVKRLSIILEEMVFSPIPTITQFAKEALFRGVPPDKISWVGNIGVVLPEDKSPAQKLASSNGKGTYLWRVLEPDRTYHQKNRSENLMQDIAGRLEAEALKIKEVVETVPDHVLLQIIITTDHGRLLGRSVRNLPVPAGMQSHGRVAWGQTTFEYPVDGFIVEDEIAYIYGERFGLPSDMAIPLSETAFRGNDDRTGSEAYPHGGLFPEEVILPWVVFARDYVQPKVEVSVTGDGRARSNGQLQIKVLNASDVNLVLDELILTYRNGSAVTIPLSANITARYSSTFEKELEPWPSANDAKGITATAKLRQPNGLAFEYQATTDIQSKDIYDRGENILEDLL